MVIMLQSRLRLPIHRMLHFDQAALLTRRVTLVSITRDALGGHSLQDSLIFGVRPPIARRKMMTLIVQLPAKRGPGSSEA